MSTLLRPSLRAMADDLKAPADGGGAGSAFVAELGTAELGVGGAGARKRTRFDRF